MNRAVEYMGKIMRGLISGLGTRPQGCKIHCYARIEVNSQNVHKCCTSYVSKHIRTVLGFEKAIFKNVLRR